MRKLVKIGEGVWVNPDHVARVVHHWDNESGAECGVMLSGVMLPGVGDRTVIREVRRLAADVARDLNEGDPETETEDLEPRAARVQAVKDRPGFAADCLEMIAVLCGNHHRRGGGSDSLKSLATAVLMNEGRIRQLLTGDENGEILGPIPRNDEDSP